MSFAATIRLGKTNVYIIEVYRYAYVTNVYTYVYITDVYIHVYVYTS